MYGGEVERFGSMSGDYLSVGCLSKYAENRIAQSEVYETDEEGLRRIPCTLHSGKNLWSK